MRVKILIALALASVLLLSSTGLAMASGLNGVGCGAGCICGPGCPCGNTCNCANGNMALQCDCLHTGGAVPMTPGSVAPTTPINTVPVSVNLVPVSSIDPALMTAQLTDSAMRQCKSCGFPDLSSVNAADTGTTSASPASTCFDMVRMIEGLAGLV